MYEQYSTNINTIVTNTSFFIPTLPRYQLGYQKRNPWYMEFWEVTDAEFPNVYFKRKLRKNQAKKRQGVRLKLLCWRVVPRSKVSWLYNIMIASHSTWRLMRSTKFNGSIKIERCSENIYKEHQRSLFIASMRLKYKSITWILLMLLISSGDPTVLTIGCAKGNGSGIFFSCLQVLLTNLFIIYKSIWYCTDRIQLANTIFKRQIHWRRSVKMHTGQKKLITRNAFIPSEK